MEESKEQEKQNTGQLEIKVEPTMQCYVEEDHENGFPSFENANSIPSSADVGTVNLWTNKATSCLISQYKKYRSMVGQSTQIRSLREMFEMISLEMQNHGFYFSPQKCENKWRVLERKYKNIVFRERLKKPGRMRHYGHWEHKRALDEIFNEKKRHIYLEENDFTSPSGSGKLTVILPKSSDEQGNSSSINQQQDDPLLSFASATTSVNKRIEEMGEQRSLLTTLFDKLLEEMSKNFEMAERNKERRHKEKMALRQSELEVKKKILKLKEQKMELQKCQIIAAAQHLHLNME